MKGIYIKQTKRKCSISDYNCFDVYDDSKKKMPIKDCDVIELHAEEGTFSLEIVNGMIHLWSFQDLKVETLVNTVVVEIPKGEK